MNSMGSMSELAEVKGEVSMQDACVAFTTPMAANAPRLKHHSMPIDVTRTH